MELVWTVLPFLAFLACPLMMLVCMRGMGKAGHGAARMGDSPAASGLPSERVAALQQQLQTIQAELAMLKAADPRASQDPASADEDRVVTVAAVRMVEPIRLVEMSAVYNRDEAVPHPA